MCIRITEPGRVIVEGIYQELQDYEIWISFYTKYCNSIDVGKWLFTEKKPLSLWQRFLRFIEMKHQALSDFLL